MNAKNIAKVFNEKKYQLNMGAGKLGKMYNVSKDVIYSAKEIARKNIPVNNLPKILVFDIETTPLLAYVYQTQVWKARIDAGKVVTDWLCVTWAAKWLFSPDVISLGMTSEEIANEDDSRIVKELWKLFDEADIIIAHNGKRFDVPNMNAKFLIHGLIPPSPYVQIDTLEVAKKNFGFTYNNLNYICSILGIDGKIETSFELWKGCMKGDRKSLLDMEKYNRNDTIILEEVYLRLRPWIKNHPNLGVYMELDTPVCKNCGSDKLTYMNKYHHTQTGKFELYRCDCGAIGRRRLNSFNKDKKDNLLV
jgi:hypothetical protein